MFFKKRKSKETNQAAARPEDIDFFGIYVHWPYCAKICPYCDFNVYAAKQRDNTALVDAIIRDLEAHRAVIGRRVVTSVYFGGGTPSLAKPEELYAILGKITELWTVHSAVEITVETNPEDVFPGKLSIWRDIGINRLSLGVQSLNNNALSFLGRQHTRDDALTAISQSLEYFPNTSADLIYARPGQSEDGWLSELNELLSTGIPHLSLYELTIKEKTAFEKQVERGGFIPLDDDAQADLYLATLKATGAAGLPAYEVSNHAKNESYWSRHNLTYWLGGDWIGVGPGAEGRFFGNDSDERIMTRAIRRPAEYIAATGDVGFGWDTETGPLTPVQDADERLIMGLRSVRGVSRTTLENLYGKQFDPAQIDGFVSSGHLEIESDRLKLTHDGWLLADFIASKLSPVFD
ncbi:MAG: coproporphyrinogen III oxidase [Ponticaulis sp.]|nr:coproporphyrinogen III oxidase [Ponticaulis sp.]